jgi:hypothetical protein
MLITIVFISLIIIGDPADDLDRSKAGPSKVKHRQATTSFTTPLGATISLEPRLFGLSPAATGPCALLVKATKKQVIILD